MGIKDTFSQAPSPKEEALYKRVLDEVEAGVMRKGIFAKALADCLGDEKKAHSLYIKYRVQSLADEKKYEAKHIAYEKKQAVEQEKIESKKKEERDKKLAEEQFQKDNSNKGFIKKLKNGYYGLATTFWIFGVIGIPFLYFLALISPILFSLAAIIDLASIIGLLTCLIAMSYGLTVLIGVRRAAKRYDGLRLWSILANLIAIFALVSIIPLTFMITITMNY
jgi:hypothetical protein